MLVLQWFMNSSQRMSKEEQLFLEVDVTERSWALDFCSAPGYFWLSPTTQKVCFNKSLCWNVDSELFRWPFEKRVHNCACHLKGQRMVYDSAWVASGIWSLAGVSCRQPVPAIASQCYFLLCCHKASGKQAWVCSPLAGWAPVILVSFVGRCWQGQRADIFEQEAGPELAAVG